MEQERTVLVVGAGVAGLAAAGVLAAGGFDVHVVEARDRVGGRIHTVHPEDAGGPVELGAEFVHGRPPELLRLFEEAGIALEEAKGVDGCFEDGRLTECTEDDSSNLLDELPGVVEREGDMSFDAFLQSHYPGIEMAESVRGYVEGFNAADARRIGIAALARQQQAEEAIEGDRILRPVGGYDAMAQHLAAKATQAGARILLHTRIVSIAWERGRVVARTEAGQQFAAARAVLTLPLGVLQSGGVRFEPQPAEVLAAAGRMEAGAVLRLVLIFRSAFWRQRMPDMRFLFSRDLTPATWWTQYPRDTPVLVGWLGGPRAAEAEAMDRAEFLDLALRSLERVFDLRTHALDAELHSWHLHDWLKDPLTRGAYSYAPTGALECSAAMARPVEGTLYFAGEHTDVTGHWGTVHGAIRSGLRAAQQVLAAQS